MTFCSIKSFIVLIAASSLMLSSGAASAWDGAVTGTISQIDAEPSGENRGFRVVLQGKSSLCGTTENWAYLNKSMPNYDAMASLLMLAFSSNKQVILYMNVDSTGSYCEIGYITVR